MEGEGQLVTHGDKFYPVSSSLLSMTLHLGGNRQVRDSLGDWSFLAAVFPASLGLMISHPSLSLN